MGLVEITKNINYKINIFDLYIKLILIMPITTLLQNKIDFINRAVFLLIFVLQMIILIKSKTEIKYFGALFVALVIYLVGITSTEELTFNNSIIYYINWIIYAIVMCIHKERFIEWIKKSKKYVYVIVWIWTIVVTFSIFLPSSYYIKEGGSKYFGSFAGDIFRLGPTALFIITLSAVIISVYKDRKAIKFIIIPLFCGFMGSSRTYFVIIAMVAIIVLYFWCKDRKQFMKIMIPCAFLGILVFNMSSLSNKVAYTQDANNYGDFWFRITSSRSLIWTKILKAFNEFTWQKKMLGSGYGVSANIAGHYAHNDFIEILTIHGYAGLFLYFYVVIEMLKKFLNSKESKFLILLAIIVWGFNAMFNMFYYYICAALSFPFLLIAINLYKTEEKEDNKEINEEIKKLKNVF